MKTVRLITCDSTTEAYLIKVRLESEGINCFLTNENFTNLLPNYNGMLGAGIQVIVDQRDLELSRKLIQNELQPQREELVCPNCGSSEIELGLGKRHKLKILNILLSILFFIPIGNQKTKYNCKQCQFEIR